MNKKAELTSKQLITIIILIVSFAILLIFFFALNLKKLVGDSACENSLVMKSIPGLGLVSSIQCKTQEVCISMGGECEQGEEIEVEDTEEVSSEIIELANNCWKMTGEGEVNWASSGDCGICYVAYFDEPTQNAFTPKKISRLYFYTQLIKIYGSETNPVSFFNSISLSNILEPTTFDLTKPIAVIYFKKYQLTQGWTWQGKKGIVIFSQYTAEDLRNLGCKNYPFL